MLRLDAKTTFSAYIANEGMLPQHDRVIAGPIAIPEPMHACDPVADPASIFDAAVLVSLGPCSHDVQLHNIASTHSPTPPRSLTVPQSHGQSM